ncbi:MAG: hypothetical protein IMW89_11825 [Ktedonobacteraceae bacterium]|nr:hypothetical protein [Ktedonobacteraceae bacterium]
MIPSSHRFDQSTMASLLDADPVVADYRAFFSLFDWSVVDRWQAQRSRCCGSHGHPLTASLKAFLLRIKEGLLYAKQLRDFLRHHPLLVIELGFVLQLDPSADYGFDVERTVPCRYWLGEKLRQLDRGLLSDLLAATVAALQEEIPGLGEVVAFDVKHIYAWVKENNERASVPERYDKTRMLAGDPDCRLGVKRSTNQQQPDGSTRERKELIWGYGSGVAAATTPDYGDVVLAEDTQPFNEHDITYFRPLYQQTVAALNAFSTHLTADAAYDAWYVYECAARHGGIAAVPLNQHGHPAFQRTADGTPLCPQGLPMTPTFQFAHTSGYRAQRFRCPFLFQDISPLPLGDLSSHFVPLQLAENHIFWGLYTDHDPFFKNCELAFLNAAANDLIKRASFGQEDIHLEHRIQVDHIEFTALLDGILDHLRIYIIARLQALDKSRYLFELNFRNNVYIGSGAIDPMSQAGDGSPNVVINPQALKRLNDRKHCGQNFRLTHRGLPAR